MHMKKQGPKKGKGVVPEKVAAKINDLKLQSLIRVAGTLAHQNYMARDYARFIALWSGRLTCGLDGIYKHYKSIINRGDTYHGGFASLKYTDYHMRGLISAFMRFDQMLGYSAPKWLNEKNVHHVRVMATCTPATPIALRIVDEMKCRVKIVLSAKKRDAMYSPIEFEMDHLGENLKFMLEPNQVVDIKFWGTNGPKLVTFQSDNCNLDGFEES